ncbi:MAG: hypothetical protein U9N02_07830 [Campylobacterota bacterium]|nr:hypothetical protein [Campylobacterota bacterium]
MCLVVTAIMLIMSFNFYFAGNILASVGSFLIAIFFIWLIFKNIQRVKKIKKERDINNDN